MLGFHVDELVLEFANREMAEVDMLREIADAGRDVAAGVIDVKNSYVETAGRRRRADRRACSTPGVPAERLTLVPDCGFSQTARGRDGRQARTRSSPVATWSRRHRRRPTDRRREEVDRWTATRSRCSAPG